MLARRIIPTILYRGTETFKGEGFNSWRRIGNLRQAVRVYQTRGVDELILLDISGNPPDLKLVRDLCSECFMPVTVGGGIRSLDQIVDLIKYGADKISLNTWAIAQPDLVTAASRKLGSQSVVVSIDVKDGTVWSGSGTVNTGLDPVAYAQSVGRMGAGEIVITSVTRDGTLTGYDLDLVARIAGAVSVPVVAAGGAGTYEHLKQALDAGAHAVAAGAMWSFTDATPSGAAEYLDRLGVPVRVRRAA
jgi:cyclase